MSKLIPLIPLDKYGWPVERYRKRPITNAIRLMLHTRRIITSAEWERRQAEWLRSYAEIRGEEFPHEQ